MKKLICLLLAALLAFALISCNGDPDDGGNGSGDFFKNGGKINLPEIELTIDGN